MSGEKNSIKEETRKRPGDHLDEMEWIVQYNKELPLNLLEKCKPNYCGICSAPFTYSMASSRNAFTSPAIAKSHYNGKIHKKNVRRALQSEQINEDTYNNAPKCTKLSEITATSSKKYMKSGSAPQIKTMSERFCDICNVTVNGKENLNSHLIGKRHKKKFKLIEKRQNPVRFTCHLCNVSCNARHVLQHHLQGRKHRQKLGNRQSFSCDVCGYTTVNNQTFQMHQVHHLLCLACGEGGHTCKDCDKYVKSEAENIKKNGKGNGSSDKIEVNNDAFKYQEDVELNRISINNREGDDSERKRESDDRQKENGTTRCSDAPRVDCSSKPPSEIEILHHQVADSVKKRLDMYMVGQAGTEPKHIKIKDSDEYARLAKFFSHKLRAQIKETYEQYNRTLNGVAITADNKEQIKVVIDMYFDTQPVVV